MYLKSIALFCLAALLAGCLPGQQRTAPRDLFPADSLSRQIAEAAPEEELSIVWRAEAPAEIRFPLTIAWEGDRIVMADAQRGVLHTFSGSGEYVGRFEDEVLQFPFVSGIRGDTVVVLSRGRQQVHLVQLGPQGEGTLLQSIPYQDGRNSVAAWASTGIFVKTADEGDGSKIRRFDVASRSALAEHPLEPPFWRHIGFLRVWGDTLVSVSGYRPILHVLPIDAPSGARPDTLALIGFDSPQLARSRQFVMGDTREPPLLVPSADGVGDRLFVLNARPGWAHVDVFRRRGDELILERSLLSPEAEMGRNFFAADIAVQRIGEGYDIVILENRPRPAIMRYRWIPPVDAVAAATDD